MYAYADSMRILLVAPFNHLSQWGGGEHWLLEVCNRLAARNHRIVLFTYDKPYAVNADIEEIRRNIKFTWVTSGYIRLFRNRFLSSFPNATGLLSLLKLIEWADILYLFSPYILVNALLSKLARLPPTVVGAHTSHDEAKWVSLLRMSRFFKIANIYVHTQNYEQHKRFIAMGLKSILIPNGVDPHKFYLKMNYDEFRVIFVGRLVSNKGIEILRDIIMLSSEKNPDIRFDIVGSGPLDHLILELTSSYNNVNWHGFVSDTRLLAELYARSSLFVFPSLRETFGNAVLEAQASGLPVIANNIPGPRDIIVDNLTGGLVEPNAEAFIEAIDRYFKIWKEDKSAYYQMRKEIRTITEQRYDWEPIIKRFEAVFTSIAEHR